MGLHKSILSLVSAASICVGSLQAQEHQLTVKATGIRAQMSKTVDLSAFGVGNRDFGITGSGFLVGMEYRVPIGPVIVETDLEAKYYRTDKEVPTSSGERRLDDITGDVKLRIYSPPIVFGMRALASYGVAGFVDPDLWIKQSGQYGLGGGDSWDNRINLGVANDPSNPVSFRIAYSRSSVTSQATRHGITGAVSVQITEKHRDHQHVALHSTIEATYQASKSFFGNQNNSNIRGSFTLFLPKGLPGIEVVVDKNFGTTYPAVPNKGPMHPERLVAGVGLRQTFLLK